MHKEVRIEEFLVAYLSKKETVTHELQEQYQSLVQLTVCLIKPSTLSIVYQYIM